MKRLERCFAILEKHYGLDRHHNKRDAFWELVFIVISTRTAEERYIQTYNAIRREFPSLQSIANASHDNLAAIIAPAGLSGLKSKSLVSAAQTILSKFASTRRFTQYSRADPEAARELLLSIDGIGHKISKCVLMYACDADVLPVDTHVWRVLSRLGFAPGGRLTERAAAILERSIPAKLRFAVHVLCLSHGRSICKPKPLCKECEIATMCPSAETALAHP